jgi:phosphoenolpyruvate-protein phosphotransferase (PTS system enzyme I)
MNPERPKRETVILKGIPASPGIAVAAAYVFVKETPHVERRSIEDVEAEIARLRNAIEKSSRELNKILVFAQSKVGEAKAKILEAQIMVLEDPVLIDSVIGRIRAEKINAEFIVSDEIGKYAALMLRAHDEYMHERAHDMDDLRNRIVRNLQQEKLVSRLEGDIIVVAHSLTPADTMILSRNHVLGYATDLGGVTSHAALFSRSLKIPAIVGLGAVSRAVQPGDTLILDGYSGTLVINPGDEHLAEYGAKRQRMNEFESQLSVLKDFPATTIDNHEIDLSANIELPEELEYVAMQGSQGVGLYRTESMLIGRDDFPSEDEQVAEYKQIAERLYPRRIIMRTFDVGGDKIAPEMAEEANPFLGWRGIRVGLDRPEIFLNQLRAMLRASTRKNLAIMFPMVSTLAEVRQAKEYLKKAKADLRARGQKFDDRIRVGVMIEVPGAALLAGQIAAEVNFLSIGSNDLTQYLLAVDRGNQLVSRLYREFEPSVIATLKHVINAGHKRGVWVGICGEMAGNPIATPLLVGLGMDELSVVPAILPEIKKIIRALDFSQAQEVARRVMRLQSGDAVEEYLQTYFTKKFPDIPLGKSSR